MKENKTGFGNLLRKLRENAGLSMGALAREMGVSVVFVSDVERGNRAPLTVERIIKVAAILKADPTPLIEAAAKARGSFEIKHENLPARGREFVAALARGQQLSESSWDEIFEIVNRKKRESIE